MGTEFIYYVSDHLGYSTDRYIIRNQSSDDADADDTSSFVITVLLHIHQLLVVLGHRGSFTGGIKYHKSVICVDVVRNSSYVMTSWIPH